MQLAGCPKCAMPRSEADIAERPCPLCGYVLGQVIVPHVEEPLPVVEVANPIASDVPEPKPRLPRFVAVAILLALGFGILIGREFSTTKVVESKTTVPVEIFVEAKPTAIVSAPKPLVVNIPKVETAPMPREVVVVAAPPAPPPAVALPGGVSLIRLDRPTEVFTMERIGEGNTIKLTGKVSKLVITGVDGGATVDITELETKTISFNGRIEGNARIKVNMPGGTLMFSKAISGGATIEANVPGGSIAFSSPNATVSGGVKLKLTGKSVWFHTRIDGGSQVEVVVSNAGGLRFLELAEGSKIHYRGEKPDSDVKVTPGRIDDSSECKRLD